MIIDSYIFFKFLYVLSQIFNRFNKFTTAVTNKLKYGEEGKSSSFSTSKKNFLKEYGYEPFGEFVKKASFIIDSRLGAEKFSQGATELINYINSDLIKIYPEIAELLSDDVVKKAQKSI